MALLRVAVKLLGLIGMTILAVTIPLVVRLATLNSARIVARVGSRATSLWCRWLCAILAIRVRATGRPAGSPFVVASNHVSYLDILVLGSLYASQFVAKSEIRSWPMFGWVSRGAGTLFVDRDNPRDAVRVNRTIRRHLSAGVPITLFPEGGTSRGDRVRPFQPMLLEPAASSGVPCFAASLTYETPGRADPPSETICWHSRKNIVTHLLRVMGMPRIEARVSFSPSPVRSADRKELAQRLWEEVNGSFVPIRQTDRPPRCAP